MWYETLSFVQSLGSQTPVVGGLQGCAAAREIHVGQFFTPEPIVRLLWHLLGTALMPCKGRSRINVDPRTIRMAYRRQLGWRIFA